jgi:hypothetical protein
MTASDNRPAAWPRRAFVRSCCALGALAAAVPLGGCSVLSLLGIEDPEDAAQTDDAPSQAAQASTGYADFEGLEVQVDTDPSTWSWSQINNTASASNGALVVALPVTVVNNDEQSRMLSSMYCKVQDPSGATQADISAYYSDGDVMQLGTVAAGAECSSLIHVLYQGPGTYTVVFDNLLGRKARAYVDIDGAAGSGLVAVPWELGQADVAAAVPAGSSFEVDGLTLAFASDESSYWWIQSWDESNEVWNGRWCVGVPLFMSNNTDRDLVFSAGEYALFAPQLYRLEDPAPWFAASTPAAYVGTVAAGQSVQTTMFWPYVEDGTYYAAFDDDGVKVVTAVGIYRS